MSAWFLLWIGLGVATGAVHGTALWQAAHDTTVRLRFPWRLPMVAITLVVAALVGRILPAAAGWAGGLAATSILFLARQRRWT